MRDLIKTNAALLFTGIATFVLMGAVTALYGSALPAFSRGFAVSIGTAGWLISAHWVGCAFGVAAMFVWGTRMTPRLVVALMVVGCGLMAAGLAFWATIVGGLAFGAGYGSATVVFNPRVLRAFGARGPAMLSLLNATFGIGAIAAPLVFVALGNDPMPSFALCAGIAALIMLSAGRAGQDTGATTAVSTTPFRLHVPILLFGMIAIAVEASVTGLGPSALIKAGVSEAHAAQLLSGFFIAFLAARILLGFTAHLLPSFTLFTLAIGCASLSAFAVALWVPGPPFVAMGFFTGMFFPGEFVTACRKMGDNPKVAPTIVAAGLVGGIFAPLILAPLIGSLGERGFFWIIALALGCLTLAALANLRAMNR